MDIKLKLTKALGEGFEEGTVVTSDMVIIDNDNHISVCNEAGAYELAIYNEGYEYADEDYKAGLIETLKKPEAKFEVVSQEPLQIKYYVGSHLEESDGYEAEYVVSVAKEAGILE